MLSTGSRRKAKSDCFAEPYAQLEAGAENSLHAACVYQVAARLKCSCLVTRNRKDFSQSSLPVYSPAEFLEHFARETGISYDEVAL